MKSKKTVCSCGHPRDDHSVYRPLCLITGCTCDKEGGRDYLRGALS